MSAHTCHWPGCTATVPPAMWGCRSHWFRLPKGLRDLIWSTYRTGQEITKDPSLDYIAAANAVQDWIRTHCGDEIGVPMIHTLSVLQPWAWLIVHGHKDIENRDWATSFRGRFLVHAGKRFGREQREDVAHVIQRFPSIKLPDDFALGGIVGEAELVDCTDGHPSPWFNGRFGFVLANAKPLPFRAYSGQLGFFRTPDVKPCGPRAVALAVVARTAGPAPAAAIGSPSTARPEPAAVHPARRGRSHHDASRRRR